MGAWKPQCNPTGVMQAFAAPLLHAPTFECRHRTGVDSSALSRPTFSAPLARGSSSGRTMPLRQARFFSAVRRSLGRGLNFDHQHVSRVTYIGSAGSSALQSSASAGVGNDLLIRGGTQDIALTAPTLGVVLLATACASTVFERRTKAGSIVGAPLLSFGALCVLSNLGLVPSSHAIYNLCWSFLLPLSLAVIILGDPAVNGSGGEQLLSSSDRREASRGFAGPMGRVGLSSLIGAVGSFVGVTAAFYVATSFTGGGGAFTLPRETAAQIAGGITATYIGGSVNLFAVAAAVGLMDATAAGGTSILGALAASDIFLMALYFSGLLAAHKTPLLHRFFPGSLTGGHARLDDGKVSSIQEGGRGVDADASEVGYSSRRPSLSKIVSNLSLLALGSAICLAGNTLARASPLPGTNTMAITLLAVAITRVLSRRLPRLQAGFARHGPSLATVLLNAFFASIGASGRWAQVICVAPAIFAFASLALVVHVVVMAAGAAAMNHFCGAGLGIDDMIIASNVNIGGPSTAATFAGLIGQDELVVPAAVWGTVGYAIATTLGVGVWVLLR